MKFSIATLSVFVSAALATTVSYDSTYDNKGGSLSTVACSDGPHGLLTKGYKTFGSLPDFPYIGGSSDVAGWNSASCKSLAKHSGLFAHVNKVGNCYKVTYNGKSVYMLAIDHTDSGINMSLEAMNDLT